MYAANLLKLFFNPSVSISPPISPINVRKWKTMDSATNVTLQIASMPPKECAPLSTIISTEHNLLLSPVTARPMTELTVPHALIIII